MKWIDIPPVWLALAVAAAWGIGRIDPWALRLGPVAGGLLGGLLIGGGLVLAALALWEMRRMQTTPIPHREADRLVTTGIFRRTRNPIYLGDVLILAGLILRFDAVLALPLVPLFLWWIERRFVIPEEDRLRRRFRAEFARYAQATRRWL